jgi:hypothetical protein
MKKVQDSKTKRSEKKLPKTKRKIRCRIPGCVNTADLGEFVGDFCAPCWTFMITGQIGQSQACENALRSFVGMEVSVLEGFLLKVVWSFLNTSTVPGRFPVMNLIQKHLNNRQSAGRPPQYSDAFEENK